MRREAPAGFVVVALVLAVGSFVTADQQTKLDETLSRVHGTPVMASDVRQARLLRLVPDLATDEVIQTALENRLLILHETVKNDRLEPTRESIEAARDSWRRGWPPGTDVPALMARTGMTEQSLDGWFRDDLRINAYINQRFGQVADRPARIASWLSDLRRRANLPVKTS